MCLVHVLWGLHNHGHGQENLKNISGTAYHVFAMKKMKLVLESNHVFDSRVGDDSGFNSPSTEDTNPFYGFRLAA